MSDYKSELRDAIIAANQKAACALPEIAASLSVELITRGANHYARICPWCQGKQKLLIKQSASGNWRFRCYKSSCQANQGGDTISFLELKLGLSSRDAVRYLLERAGIEHPWDRFQRIKKEGGQA